MSRFDLDMPGRQTKEEKTANKTFAWSFNQRYFFRIACYTFETYLKQVSTDHIVIEKKMVTSVTYDLGKSEEVLNLGIYVFTVHGKLYSYIVDIHNMTISIESRHGVEELSEAMGIYLKEKNPLRGKNLALHVDHTDEISAIIKPIPDVTFDNVIVPAGLKEDIYDNTIYHLEHLSLPTGVIMYGAPGTGKSLICSAIISEVLKKGYNACYISSFIDFDGLDELIEQFISPCVVVFEDIDSFGFSREEFGINSGLSKFLQFINGISDRKDPIVFIATTNHLDKLDAAISERPVRFNRKFEFKTPTDKEIDQLMELYFGTDEFAGFCHGNKFTGAHIREIKRTADIQLLKKGGGEYRDVIKTAIAAVKSNFAVSFQEFGFHG